MAPDPADRPHGTPPPAPSATTRGPRGRTLRRAAARWAWGAWLAFGVVALFSYYLAPIADQRLHYDLIATLSAAGILAGTLLHRSSKRRQWLVAALGIALYASGDVVYSYLSTQGPVGFPSFADVLYAAGYLLFAGGIAWLVEPDIKGALRPATLDAALVATAIGIVAWRLILQPAAQVAADPVSATVAMLYPGIDVLLVFILLRHLLSSSQRSLALWILAAGVFSFLLSDFAYASMSLNGTYDGGAVDAGWQLGYVLFGAAALHPTMRRLTSGGAVIDPISNGRIALIVVAVCIGWAGLLVEPGGTRDLLGTAVAAALMGGIGLVRLVGSLVETRGLLGEARTLRDRMVDQALTDALTGLPNRLAFTEAVQRALSRDQAGVAILFLDLDGFKTVNDTWGHSTGDELLLAAAGRLRDAVRDGDLVARLGGDEFGILAAAATEREVQPLAERIVARFRPPFALTQALVSTHPSIGIALGRSGDDGARLLRHADVAMYDAKRRGGRRWELFGAAHEALVEQYRLVNELEHAIEAGELRVHYQPIVDLDTHDVVAVEALARWQHPERGLLAPGVFIPLAESNGLVREVDRWVLRTALREVRSLLDAGAWPPGCRVHVNFSPGDLDDPAIVDVVSGALRDHAVPASTLSVEVTESALLEADRTRQHLEGIAELGVSLSLDDFGTRYAVLATLADLPFHTLKIDRSFVLSLENPARVRLFEGIIRLAERLGLDTLAEGIETDEQREAVHHLGCRLGQGYLLGRPMPPDELRRRLAAAGAARPAGRGRGTRAADWNLVPRVPGALAPAPSQRAS